MNWKRKILLLLGSGHLVLVALGAAGLDLRRIPALGAILTSYAVLSGADSQYSFFAPNVRGQLRARFEVRGEGGMSVSADLKGTTRESNLRIGNIIDTLEGQLNSSTLRRTITASLAAKMFSKFPESKNIYVFIESYDLPTMSAYGAGQRPIWKSLYEAKYLIQRTAENTAYAN